MPVQFLVLHAVGALAGREPGRIRIPGEHLGDLRVRATWPPRIARMFWSFWPGSFRWRGGRSVGRPIRRFARPGACAWGLRMWCCLWTIRRPFQTWGSV